MSASVDPTRTGAVIGCGRMGAFTSASVRAYGPSCFLPSAHAEAMEMAKGLRLVALCDADMAAVERAGQLYAGASLYTEAGALLDEHAPDLIGLATRTIGRADLIERCLEAGTRALHVEKPLCNTLSELERLEERLAPDDVFVTLGAVRRHFAVYQHALEQARSGVYGALLASHAEFGARTLYWSHPHTVDLLLFAAAGARVEAVQARLGAVEGEGATILNDPVVLEVSVWFEGGYSGHITRMSGTDWRLACETAQIAVVGNGSSVWRSGRPMLDANAPDPGPAGAYPYHEPERLPLPSCGKAEGALAPLTQLIACLNGDREAQRANAAIKRDILTGQRILFAIAQSHLEGGRPVALSAIDPALRIEARTKGAPA